MSDKYEEFVEALNSLCSEHDVHICTSGYDGLQVWDRDESYDDIYVENCIKSDKGDS